MSQQVMGWEVQGRPELAAHSCERNRSATREQKTTGWREWPGFHGWRPGSLSTASYYLEVV